MADILEQIAKTEWNEHEISLWELEKHFDEITNNEKDDKKEIAKLVKALEKNIEKKKYEIDSKWIIEKIINQDKDFSKFDKNTIKIYQLCRNLESEKAWMGKCMEIDGNIWTELIEDRIATYDENSSWLLWWESIEFDAISNKLKLITKFGIYDEVLTDYWIIDNKEKYKEFIDAKRLEHFNAFLLKNEITNPESEFKKWLTKKYPNALEDICLQYTEVGTNIVYIDYKNDDANIDYSFSLDIKSDTTPEEIIALIQKSRESYNSKIEQWEKYQEFVVEANEATKGSFADAYKNINLLLWADEYKKFSKAQFSFHDITQENIWTMQIDERGQLVIWTDKKPIFPEYDFTNIPLNQRLFVVLNISKIFQEFVTYYPDNTQRQNFGTLDSVKYNVNYEKAVQTMYIDLMKKENVDKFKKGTLNLNALNSVYRERAFGYFMSELKKNGETPASIIKNRTVDSKMFKFVEAKRDSIKENESWYVSLYYTFIQEKLWNILKITTTTDKTTKKESTTWSLEETKINTVFNSTYQWLICQKWTWENAITEAETDKKITELTKTNDRLKWLSEEQKSIILKTEVWKWLFKSAIYSKEQKKYKEVNKTFTEYEAGYNEKIKDAYDEILTAENILSNTNGGGYWGMNQNGHVELNRKSIPSIYRQYIKWDENGVPVPHWYIDYSLAKDRVYAIRKPFEEKWVEHIENINNYGLAQYVEWTPQGQTKPVNMAYAINNRKTIQSPFSDKFCQSSMNFGYVNPSDIVRDTTWEGIEDRWAEKWNAIEKDPLNGIAWVVIDVSWIVVWWIAAGVVTIVTKSPQLWALAFTATDNLVKAWWYGTLEGINYIAWTGDMGDYDNIFDAWNYGAAKWMGLLETETNQYLETSYKKDENGDLVFKDREVILAEKSLEVGSSLILFGPVGKVGWMVTKSVFNGFIFRNLEKQFGNEIAAKIFTEEISKLGEKEMLATFGKEIVTNSSKNLSHLTWFFAEVSTFTAFNAFYSPFSSWVVTYAQTGDMNQALVAAEAAWEESFSTKWLLTNFVHNVWFIGLLKWSNLLVDPMSSKIMTSAEKYKYTKSKVQADQLWSQLDVEMKKEQIEALSNENILEYMSKGAEFKGIENMKEWWFFKKTATWFEYVTPDAIPKITEINNKITQLKVEISMLMQSLAVKTESLKNVEEIQKFNDFVVKNQLEWMEVSSEIILQKRIEYCEAKIKTTEWTEKTKYEEMLETLNAQKIELATLREWYLKTIDLIEVSENGILKIKNENIQKTDTEANNVEVSTGSISEISTIVEKKWEVNGDIVSDNIIANKDWSTLTTPEIQELYIKWETAKTELWNLLKSKAITKQEYIKQLQILEKEYPTIADITSAKERDIIKKYGYEISKEKIQDYIQKLWVDIQWWGSNAQWVHEIMETNLVAVIKSEWSFVYELPQKSLMNWLTTSRVPRIVDVFLYEGKTYKIMERSPGKSVEKLSLEEIKNIPQEHYDNYVRDLKELETVGLQVDPSKASNVFYDKETWFHFIDLGIKESTISMFDNIKNLQLGKWILNWKQIQIAEKNAEYEKVFYKVHQTIFTEIQNNKPYTLETVELNWCTAATVLITNKEWKKFALSTHFPPISNFSEQQLSQIHKFLQTNKSKIGDIASVEMFAVTDVWRKNNDYQKIVDAIQQETSIQPNMHLSEYNSRDKSRANTEDLGKMNIKIDKEGNIKFIHEGKKVIQTELKDDNKKKETTRRSAVDKKIVEKNAILADGPRLQEAEKLLWTEFAGKLINPDGTATELGQKILDAYNNSKWGEIYKITPEQLTEKVRILKDAGFVSDEIRILIENGICGKVEMEVMDVNKNGVFDKSDVEMMGDNVESTEINASMIISQLAGKNFLEIARAGKIEWTDKNIVNQIMSIVSDAERLEVAEFLLNRKLTEEEKNVIIEAHETIGNIATLLKLRKVFPINDMTILTRRGVCGMLMDRVVKKLDFTNLFKKNNVNNIENIKYPRYLKKASEFEKHIYKISKSDNNINEQLRPYISDFREYYRKVYNEKTDNLKDEDILAFLSNHYNNDIKPNLIWVLKDDILTTWTDDIRWFDIIDYKKHLGRWTNNDWLQWSGTYLTWYRNIWKHYGDTQPLVLNDIRNPLYINPEKKPYHGWHDYEGINYIAYPFGDENIKTEYPDIWKQLKSQKYQIIPKLMSEHLDMDRIAKENINNAMENQLDNIPNMTQEIKNRIMSSIILEIKPTDEYANLYWDFVDEILKLNNNDIIISNVNTAPWSHTNLPVFIDKAEIVVKDGSKIKSIFPAKDIILNHKNGKMLRDFQNYSIHN